MAAAGFVRPSYDLLTKLVGRFFFGLKTLGPFPMKSVVSVNGLNGPNRPNVRNDHP